MTIDAARCGTCRFHYGSRIEPGPDARVLDPDAVPCNETEKFRRIFKALLQGFAVAVIGLCSLT